MVKVSESASGVQQDHRALSLQFRMNRRIQKFKDSESLVIYHLIDNKSDFILQQENMCKSSGRSAQQVSNMESSQNLSINNLTSNYYKCPLGVGKPCFRTLLQY